MLKEASLDGSKFKRETFNIWPLNMVFAEGFYSCLFIWLRTFSSIPGLLRNWSWILSTLSLHLLIWSYGFSYIDIFYLPEPYWSTKTTSHLHSWNRSHVVWSVLILLGFILFVFCWEDAVDVLFRFPSGTGLRCSWLIMPRWGLDTKIMLTSPN